jgi:hypothetical protein
MSLSSDEHGRVGGPGELVEIYGSERQVVGRVQAAATTAVGRAVPVRPSQSGLAAEPA